jgi:hypothetical protein
LNAKVKNTRDLLNLDIDYLTEHFGASRFPYSTQALPVNVLLDTLIRPHGETEESERETCVAWRHDPQRAVSHVVFGSARCAGGQWVENPVKASWDIGTLSYADMLSLPGYTFAQHYWKANGKALPSYTRPSRRAVAAYFAAYPFQVGIEDTIHCDQKLAGIIRTEEGFYIASHGMKCKHLVLASGIFSELIPARPLLQPLLNLPGSVENKRQEPLLVVGSGFSAADVIISAPFCQRIIHIFKWAPTTHPSPLRACHQQAYPEYAGVYRRMKMAALDSQASKARRPRISRSTSTFDSSRDWESMYEGCPNTFIADVHVQGDTAVVTLQRDDGTQVQRAVSGLAYVIGRRGSLNYLDKALRQEVCGPIQETDMISGRSLREKALDDLEVAPGVFIVGSLTGDSLIRFAFGSCTYVAGKIMDCGTALPAANGKPLGSRFESKTAPSSSSHLCTMNGLDGHNGLRTCSEDAPDYQDWRRNSE